jgi:hypothetical protein
MKSQIMAAVIGATMLTAAPVLTQSANAQPAPMGSSGGYIVPVVVGAAAGAVVGAFVWPMIVPGAAATAMAAAAPAEATVAAAPMEVAAAAAPVEAAAAAAPAEAASWGWGAFMTTRAAVGAVIGAGLGYLSAR